MNELTKTGKLRTILISISILLVSLNTIYMCYSVQPEMEIKKLVQQSIRFLFTVGVLVQVYRGINWAKILLLVLCSIAVVVALGGLFTLETRTIQSKIPFIVMICVYSIAIYHFGFSKSFKAFFKAQNGGKQA